MTYPLGLPVIPQMLVRRERWLGGYKVQSSPLVYPGQEVLPDQPVLRIEYEGQRDQGLAFEPQQAAFLSSLPSTGSERSDLPPAGSASKVERLPAGLRGRVVDITARGGVVIETQAAIVQGMIGAGRQVAGVMALWPHYASAQRAQTQSAQRPQVIPPGAILIVPGPLDFHMLSQAVHSGVVGVVACSISLLDLEGFLRTDLIQLINSKDSEQIQAQLTPRTLRLTEVLGTFAMPAHVTDLLTGYQGSIALLSGTTAVRQGLFPELVISLPVKEAQKELPALHPDVTLRLGARVRVSGGECEGAIGVIDHFFLYPQVFPSGIRARAVRLKLENGTVLIVPTTLIERCG